jgi:hypothetical protein
VLPFAEQLHEADVQRVLDAVDERLYPGTRQSVS